MFVLCESREVGGILLGPEGEVFLDGGGNCAEKFCGHGVCSVFGPGWVGVGRGRGELAGFQDVLFFSPLIVKDCNRAGR